MLTSKARRRLAQKTSALGIASVLAFVTGSALLSSPAAAQASAGALAEQTLTYNCAAGAFEANTAVTLKVATPTSVEPSKQAQVTWTLPTTLKAAQALAVNTKVEIKSTLTVGGGGSPASLVGASAHTLALAVAAGATYTPNPTTVTANVTAPSAAGTVTLSPGTVQTAKTLQLVVTPPGGTAAVTTDCTLTTATPATISIPVQTGTGTGDEIIQYDCTAKGEPTYLGAADIKVVLAPPTTVTANTDASISWTSTVQDTGDPLKVPVGGFPASGSKVFGTIKATGAGAPNTATGEISYTGSTTAGSDIVIPVITVKIKPTTTGEMTIIADTLAFGTSASDPALKCVPSSTPKSYKVTVSAGTGSQSPSPSATTTSATPKPTKTTTKFVTETPKDNGGKVTKTPKAGADTGGGGGVGPDGRMFILTGSLLILAAGVGGLVMRRRGLSRG
ncbi:hypothetical protein [Nonomuraea typhae]|uniref:hypothetical protein n=1 Tax=Nonomuraea typhae TaxID=2603600 RepID=UPI0012FA87C7|nr:hypothetical protein [Nonomuraea typhae]